MDIDLLFTPAGDAGLICRGNLVKKVVGAVFDPPSGIITLEYVDMDHEELNIPVEAEFVQALDRCPQIHLGGVKDGEISQAYQIPFMFLDDPYRMDSMANVKQHPNPLAAFDRFVKACDAGQPVNRDDLGDEGSMGCVLGEASPSALQFAPHLARRHALEVAPKAQPSGPGPSTPGLGGGGGGYSGGNHTTRRGGQDDNQS